MKKTLPYLSFIFAVTLSCNTVIGKPTPFPTLQSPGTPLATSVEKDGAVMVYIPAGAFLMGTIETEIYALPDEKPQRVVTLDAFWIDQTETTNKQYAMCVAAGNCKEPITTSSETREKYYDAPEFNDYPVIYVSWHDAQAYCEWAGRRLPTEAEWEKAARGTDARQYPWGLVFGDLANYEYKVGDTSPVGKYPGGASFYGVYDMGGNAYEWVADWYDENYYRNAPSSNPKGPASGELKVMRGGAWISNLALLTTTARNKSNPDHTFFTDGFRCAKSE